MFGVGETPRGNLKPRFLCRKRPLKGACSYYINALVFDLLHEDRKKIFSLPESIPGLFSEPKGANLP